MSGIEKKFKIGDVVVLKSGGPTMTVNGFHSNMAISGPATYSGRVNCTWFNDKNQKEESRFHQDSLEIEE